jgi:hypothetical protein
MDEARIDSLMQFALAVARCVHDDAWGLSSLGEIHLLKYAYLGDLAYAEKNNGTSYTDAPWMFYHFGPWVQSAQDRAEPAMHAIGATRDEIEGDRGVFVRWSIRDLSTAQRIRSTLKQTLPRHVCFAISEAVRRHGNVTSDLLHQIYGTPPMLHAAPRERLDLMRMVLSEAEPLRRTRIRSCGPKQ